MGLSVGQRQRRAPRSTEQLPSLDAKALADALHVGDEVPGRIRVERGVRGGLAGAALVEQDDAVALGVVQATHEGV